MSPSIGREGNANMPCPSIFLPENFQRSRMLSPSVLTTYWHIFLTRLSSANTRSFPLGSRSRTSTPSRTGLALVSFCHGRVSDSTGCVAATDSLTCWTPKGTQFPTANCWSRWTKSNGEGSARTEKVSDQDDGWASEIFTAPQDGDIRTGQRRGRIALESVCSTRIPQAPTVL